MSCGYWINFVIDCELECWDERMHYGLVLALAAYGLFIMISCSGEIYWNSWALCRCNIAALIFVLVPL